MPRAGIGVVFLFLERVVVTQFQPRSGFEQRDTINFAAARGNVFLITPAQPAKEIQLPLLGVVVVGRIRAGQCVIAGPVDERIL